ncbi:MAG: SGNH/GDSL hydrolase family protein [Dermatophilaceae bacterium]
MPVAPWRRYVAIGDSFTEGMCDPDPDAPDEFVGWADRLATLLARVARARSVEFSYANLAVRGRLLDDVVDRQLPLGLELRPDLISIVGGANDIMRARVDLTALAGRLERAVEAARAMGADVLLATPTDPAGAPLIRALRGRHAIHTANVWTIARRHRCHVIDQWGFTALQDWQMWAEDRIHMTTEGHRRVALAAFAALGLGPVDLGPHHVGPFDLGSFDQGPTGAGLISDRAWETPLPTRPAPGRVEWARQNKDWAAQYLGPWVRRRLTGRSSGDLRHAKRPELTRLDVAD